MFCAVAEARASDGSCMIQLKSGTSQGCPKMVQTSLPFPYQRPELDKHQAEAERVIYPQVTPCAAANSKSWKQFKGSATSIIEAGEKPQLYR